MKIAFYKANSEGLGGLVDRLIRWRLNGPYSHCELVFEPGDGVIDLVPDRNLHPAPNGALWCATATMMDQIPVWSKRRAGHQGGVRFKRIALDPQHWDFLQVRGDLHQCVEAAKWFAQHEGDLYDLRGVLGYVNFLIPQDKKRYQCAEAVAIALGFPDAHRYDPCSLYSAVRYSEGQVAVQLAAAGI